MAVLTIKENPTITDTIVFDIETPGVDGCFNADPYKVEKITIYFVSRDFNSGNLQNYELSQYDENKLKAAEEAEAKACAYPTDENILAAKKLRTIAEDSNNINNFYYKEAEPIAVFGGEDYPVWFSENPEDDILEHITTDENNNTIYGKFKFTWQPQGMREGDYFICWTWAPLIAGELLSSHQKFSLMGDTQTTTSIPTHFTNPKKYKTLLDRYLPEMFKSSLAESDVTPDVLNRMNSSLSMGFNVLENLTNQMVDLLDANSLHEFLIPYLSNLFGLKLKTSDPTRWRGQIKRAVPLYKKKGTKNGLYEALDHGGITLRKINRLWQVVSSYTWQESFFCDGTNNEFILAKAALPIDVLNFELWLRPNNEYDWTQLGDQYISLTTIDGKSSITWVGDNILVNPIPLMEGDEIRILYSYNEIPNNTMQSIEDYIRTLPLMDKRDVREQTYPLKNWNVRVISEDDPMFPIIIPSRNPFHECLVYGKIRTEFPYSENIYHMDEYNGCCVGSTLVVTENGIKKIKDIKNDKLIMTEFGFKKFEELKSQGERGTLKIKTSLGKEIVVTPNHKFRIINELGVEWKQAIDLEENDFVLCKKGNCNSIPKNKGMNKDLWYLAGHLYGDGCIHQRKNWVNFRWLVSEKEPEIKSFILFVLKNNNAKYNIYCLTKEKHQRHTSLKCNQELYRISTSNAQLPLLNDILPGYEPKGRWKKSLPVSIWQSGEEQICSFLRGLFDTDGGMQKRQPLLTTKWKNLAQEVQHLLLSIGIISSVTSYKVSWNGKKNKYFRVRILGKSSREIFKEKIGFNSFAKKQSLDEAIKLEEKSILEADRAIVPFGSRLIKSIFPRNKRISKIKTNLRTREEKRIVGLISRLKQGCQKTIPDNAMIDIYQKAKEFGLHNDEFLFVKNYVENDWFFDKIKKVSKGSYQEVFDPINVKDTTSYISNGIVSHNSIRDSKNPCDIDKDFLDPCSACVSSNYNLDLEVEEISDDKIQEVKEIIQENAPFHSVLHTLNLTGGFNEFIEPPSENVEMLATYSGGDFVVAGQAQPYFHRIMKDVENKGVLRDQLANSTLVYSSTGTAYNNEITLFCPSTVLSNVGVDSSGNSFVEIKAPSPLMAGEYNVVSSDGHTVAFVVPSGEPITNCCSSEPPPYPNCITNPSGYECCPPYSQYDDIPRNSIFYCSHLNNCSFTFDLNNIVEPINGTLCDIYQDNIYKIQDSNEDFASLGIKTQKDVDRGNAAYAWTINIPSYSINDYVILDITADGSILIGHDFSLPNSNASGVVYSIKDNGDPIILNNNNTSSNNGFLKVTNRGRVKALSPTSLPVFKLFSKRRPCYQKINSIEYLVTFTVDNTNDQYYLDGYNGGDVAGLTVYLREKLVKEQIGYLSFKGINLTLAGNLENILGIQNGDNYLGGDPLENNLFKENFIIFIDNVMYWMAEINGNSPPGNTTINLSGPGQYWKTLTFGGTPVNVEIYRYDKLGATIDGQNFDLPQHTFQTIDRNGMPVITITELYSNNNISVINLSTNETAEAKDFSKKDGITDYVGQKEEITFQVDYKNGDEK